MSELQRMGVNLFEFVDNPVLMEVHVFLAEKFSGTTVSLQPFFNCYSCKNFFLLAGDIVETEEMSPRWFELENIPFSQMWPDDERWYPVMLANRRREKEEGGERRTFDAFFLFQGFDTILKERIDVVEEKTKA